MKQSYKFIKIEHIEIGGANVTFSDKTLKRIMKDSKKRHREIKQDFLISGCFPHYIYCASGYYWRQKNYAKTDFPEHIKKLNNNELDCVYNYYKDYDEDYDGQYDDDDEDYNI